MSAGAAILAWMLLAVNAWGAKPLPPNETARAAEVRQQAAESVYKVSYDADEPPVYQGKFGRARTAILLTSIESLESRFLERILNGHCRPDECDSGRAVSGLQIHMGKYGIRLVGDKAAQCFLPMANCYKAFELVDDWDLAHRVGLHIYRTNPAQYSTILPALRQANEWMVQHPPPATDEQVLSGAMVD